MKAVKRIELQTPPPPVFDIIGLTLEEAKALLFITGRIGGLPETTPRGVTDKIGLALRSAGVPEVDYPTDDGRGRAIYFKECQCADSK